MRRRMQDLDRPLRFRGASMESTNLAREGLRDGWMEWTYYGDTSALAIRTTGAGLRSTMFQMMGTGFRDTLVQSEPARVFYMRNSTVATWSN